MTQNCPFFMNRPLSSDRSLSGPSILDLIHLFLTFKINFAITKMAFKMCILICDVAKDGNLSMSRLGAIDSIAFRPGPITKMLLLNYFPL